jgi:hypothetical protein
MVSAREYPYRATFATRDGREVHMLFMNTGMALARDHAAHVAAIYHLRVADVRRWYTGERNPHVLAALGHFVDALTGAVLDLEGNR